MITIFGGKQGSVAVAMCLIAWSLTADLVSRRARCKKDSQSADLVCPLEAAWCQDRFLA